MTLSELSGSIVSGISTYPLAKNGIYPRYGSTGIIGFSDKYEYEGTKILVARVGANAGRLSFVKGKYGVSDNALIVDILEDNDVLYIFYQLDAMNLNNLIFGSGQPLITGKQLKELNIPYFPQPEQTAIAAALFDTDALIDSLEKLIAKKQAIKQGTMQELLTGKRRLKGFSGEWKVKKIGECAEILQGGTPNTFNSIYWNGDIIWVTPSDISKLKKLFIDSSEKTISIEGLNNSSAKLLPKGTILLCTRATIGYLAIADKPMATNQGFKNLVCNSSVDNIFMAYLLSTKRQEMEANAIGSTFLEISKTVLSNMEVRIPSINEQQAIAQILTDMDNEISALQKKLDKVRRIKQGMMAELLTGRIRLN